MSLKNILLLEKLEKIEKDIVNLDTKISRLLELFEVDCKKMSNHIDFVENVYENIKTPFAFIMNTVNDYTKKTITDEITHEKTPSSDVIEYPAIFPNT